MNVVFTPNWWSNYNIEISGTAEEQEAVADALRSTLTDVQIETGAKITIRDAHDVKSKEGVTALAVSMAKAAPDASFRMKGLIDTTFTAGECQDFSFELKNGRLTGAFSVWYVYNGMENIKSYKDFKYCVYEDCTKKEYNAIKDKKCVYILETSNGKIISDHVPMGEPKEIPY